LKARLELLRRNAEAYLSEGKSVTRDSNFFKRKGRIPAEPIYIASSEGIGTNRVRANHVDACIDYCLEQEYLKKNKAPI